MRTEPTGTPSPASKNSGGTACLTNHLAKHLTSMKESGGRRPLIELRRNIKFKQLMVQWLCHHPSLPVNLVSHREFVAIMDMFNARLVSDTTMSKYISEFAKSCIVENSKTFQTHVKRGGFFSLIADGWSTKTKLHVFGAVVAWADQNFDLHTKLIGLEQLDDGKAETVGAWMLRVLEDLGVPFKRILTWHADCEPTTLASWRYVCTKSFSCPI